MEENGAVARPRLFETVLFGGLSIGILDLLDASIFFPNYFGMTVQRVWQGVAAGLLGRESAIAGGWNTAFLGILLHFVVATCIATVYFLFSSRISVLIKHPVISGITYGILAHFVMQFVVIPLSAIGWRSTPFDSGSFANSIIGHALLVGLPVALIASWSSRRA
ncbi:MAG: hypothetical protein KIT61_07375 [Pyrinomonadaceae bacterium]|jgi:hypothetical protein|nr:hypothetical protein [Blastocatellia bacterium]MCW5956389.1 hypothetical protein [Pyrinomonadaceae bacterium]